MTCLRHPNYSSQVRKMSLKQWADNGRLKPHQTGQKEIRDLSGAGKVEKVFTNCNIRRALSGNKNILRKGQRKANAIRTCIIDF